MVTSHFLSLLLRDEPRGRGKLISPNQVWILILYEVMVQHLGLVSEQQNPGGTPLYRRCEPGYGCAVDASNPCAR